MTTSIYRLVVAFLISPILLINSSCETVMQNKEAAIGAALGTGIGAGVGAALGKKQGALIGAGVGLISGALIGHYIAKQERTRTQTTAAVGYRPRSASFSPNGATVAVGFIDHPRVDLLSGKDLSAVATLDASGTDPDQHFVSVAWAHDGKIVYAAGTYQARGKTLLKRGTTLIRRWIVGTAHDYQDYPVAEGSIEQLVALKNGSVLFGSHDPALGIIDSSGTRTHFLDSPIADFRGMGDEFKISEDATIVRFAYNRGELFLKFSLAVC